MIDSDSVAFTRFYFPRLSYFYSLSDNFSIKYAFRVTENGFTECRVWLEESRTRLQRCTFASKLVKINSIHFAIFDRSISYLMVIVEYPSRSERQD